MSVQGRIQALFDVYGVPHTILQHDYADTSPSVALARGTPLYWGGKALVFKLGRTQQFALFAINADRQVHSKQIRHHLGLSRLRFATKEELLTLTGLTPGCVPPFGAPIFDLPLYVDSHLAKQDTIAFSMGSHTTSVTLSIPDYLEVAKPTGIFDFAEVKT